MKWINEEYNNIPKKPLLVICINKCDLPVNIDISLIADWAIEYDCPIIQTSAATGTNIKNLFTKIASLLEKQANSFSEVQRINITIS